MVKKYKGGSSVSSRQRKIKDLEEKKKRKEGDILFFETDEDMKNYSKVKEKISEITKEITEITSEINKLRKLTSKSKSKEPSSLTKEIHRLSNLYETLYGNEEPSKVIWENSFSK